MISSGVGQNLLDVLSIAPLEVARLSKLAFPLGALLGQDVIAVASAMLDLAGSCNFESLGGTAMCLHFRHDLLLRVTRHVGPGSTT